MYACPHQNLAGKSPGFDSKSEQLTSITIMHTNWPPPVHIWSGTHSVVGAITKSAWHFVSGTPWWSQGCTGRSVFWKTLRCTHTSSKTDLKRSLRPGHHRDQREKLLWCCQIRFALNLKTEWVPAGEVRWGAGPNKSNKPVGSFASVHQSNQSNQCTIPSWIPWYLLIVQP